MVLKKDNMEVINLLKVFDVKVILTNVLDNN